MNFSLFIARRYLFSKKSHNVINVISGISMVGIGVCSMALIIVLSAFNGIEDLVGSLYSAFDSELRITAVKGKTLDSEQISKEAIKKIPGVKYYSEVIEESIGLKFQDRQSITTMKGVDDDFLLMSGLDTMMYEGVLSLHENGYNFAVLGRGVKNELGVQISALNAPNLEVFALRRGKKKLASKPMDALITRSLMAGGVFSINAELDSKYTLVPIGFAREILDYKTAITAIELGLEPGFKDQEVKRELVQLLGDDYEIKTRYEQNSVIFETTQTEKWITFLILSFILLIAAFNIIASLTMLMLEKKQDVNVLVSMGANRSTIRNIFFFEGLLINAVGGFSGILLGFLVCGAQVVFKLVRLGGSVAEYYPIKMMVSDFTAVFIIVLLIGVLISWVPVQIIMRKYFDQTKASAA